MNSDFKSEKIEKYNHIEKYDMKWISKNKINIMSVPVIPNRTRSFNSYSLSQIEMESDILDLDYNIEVMNLYKTNEYYFLLLISEFNFDIIQLDDDTFAF